MELKDGQTAQSQDAAIDDLNIITKEGKELSVKLLLVEFSYFEDLFASSISGYITLRDGFNIIGTCGLNGVEFLDISFGKAKNSTTNLRQRVRIYHGEIKPVGNMNSQMLKLYFCSEELVLAEQMKIKRDFSSNISDMVYQILTEDMKVSEEKIKHIESTIGVYDFTIPTLNPFKAINWLSLYARPTFSDLVGADMVFFQNRDGYNFRSISSMRTDAPIKTLNYQQNNLPGQDLASKYSSVLDFEVVKSFNALNDISNGTYANRVIVVDPFTRSYVVKDFDYNEYIKKVTPVNGAGVMPEYTNRLGLKTNQNYEGKIKVIWGNSGQAEKDFISDYDGAVAHDVFAEEYVRYRTAQLSLAYQTVLKLKVPGDPTLSVGKVVDFNVYSLINETNRQLDKYYSGKYLITAVRHVIQSQGVYQTILEISKDSSVQPYSSSKDMTWYE